MRITTQDLPTEPNTPVDRRVHLDLRSSPQDMGSGIGQGIGEAADAANKYQQEQQAVQREDEITKAKQVSNDVDAAQKNYADNFKQLQGEDAYNASKNLDGDIAALKKGVYDKYRDQGVGDNVFNRVDLATAHDDTDLKSHLTDFGMAQRGKWMNDVNTGQIAAATDNAISNYKDENAYAKSMGDLAQAFNSYADRQPWANDTDTRSNKFQELTSHVGKNIVERNIDNEDLTGAKKSYGDLKDTMLGIDQGVSEKRIDELDHTLTERAKVEKDKTEARAEKAVNDMGTQISSGRPATPQQWDTWKSLTAGTSFSGQFDQMFKDENKVQSVLRMDIPSQMKYAQDQTADLMQNGGDARKAANVKRLNDAINKNVTTLTNTPLIYSQQRTGLSIKPLDINAVIGKQGSDQSALAQQMQDRYNTNLALQRENGNMVPIKPLLPEDEKSIPAALQSMGPKEQADALASMSHTFGPAYIPALNQIGKNAPVLALAGSIASSQAAITTNTHWFKPDETLPSRDIAGTMLAGDKALRDDKAGKTMPKDADIRSAMDTYIGGSFANNPKAYDTAYQGIRAYYAGAASQDGDVSGIIDNKRMNESLRAVVGNISRHGGSDVVLPYGMSEATFDGAAKNAFAKAAKDGGLPDSVNDQFDHYGMQKVNDSDYYIKVGNQFLPDKSGKPLKITIGG